MMRTDLVLLGVAVWLAALVIAGTEALISEQALRKFNINEKEWNEAQDVINKLLDESIANRVTEAEHDVTNLLEQNIADHLKKKGNAVLAGVQKDCKDQLDHCDQLAKAGVCETSKGAMTKHCARTCDLCGKSPTKYLDLTSHLNFLIKPKIRKPHKAIHKEEPHKKVRVAPKATKKVKVVPKATTTANSARKFDLLRAHKFTNPMETFRGLHSLGPLLSHASKAAVNYHKNDLNDEEEKIHDAQKLLEYAKVLHVPRKLKSHIEAQVKIPVSKIESTIAKKVAQKRKDKKTAAKDSAKKNTSSKSSKSHVTKKASKQVPKGVKLENLSKTITYKNQKYKITPVVDWEKISKVLKSLGYKAVHIVGMKDSHLQKGLKEHLEKHGIHNAAKDKPHAATESFVSAVHREKTWRNKEYFDAHCHKMCLDSCVASCAPGCCKEHDQVSIKTGRPKHCHPACVHACIPSCGSGCCSQEDELKRGHHFLHYGRIESYHQVQKDKQQEEKTLEDNVKCHPQCKQTCIASCGAGCCSDDEERKRKDEAIKKKEEKEREKVKEKDRHSTKSLYAKQSRMCPAPCPSVCAPACSDVCCSFGQFAPRQQDVHPALRPNVPYPQTKVIPANAFACKESCKFSCSVDCPRDCCQPEEAAAEAMHADQMYSAEQQQHLAYPQSPAFPYAASYPQTCPSPCPGNCFPSCTVDCCTSALGFNQPMDTDPEGRSSTRKVLHITHILRPVPGLPASPLQCPVSCQTHCTPACVRADCCDRKK